MRCELLGADAELPAFATGLPVRSLPVARPFTGTLANLGWHQTALPLTAALRRYDVVFLPAANRRVPCAMPCPTVGTVHDFSSLHVSDKYDRLHLFYIRRVLPALVRRLTHVITVSESSRRDIIEHARVPDDRVTVIPNGVDTEAYRPRPRSEIEAALGGHVPVDRPYLLYVSRIEHPGKNHVALIEAFARLKAEHGIPHRLVLAGGDRERAEEVHAVARSSSAAEDIVFTGFLPDTLLPALYAGADVFVLPSLYEGFGIPLLEAMACDVPVVCADASSLPEVAGDAAVLFDPRDPASMAGRIAEVLGSPGLRDHLVQRGRERSRHFSWEVAGRRTLEVIHAVAGR